VHVVFALLLAAGAAFVWWSSGSLPDPVASHFDARGTANGTLSLEAYRVFMTGLVVLVPALLYALGGLAARLPVRFVNLPNRSHWLAPERRAATLQSLSTFGAWAALATLALLCGVHALVVHANAAHPPHLDAAPVAAAVGAYLVVLLVGMFAVLRRFLRGP